MSTAVIALDPGALGGFAWVDADGTAHAVPMPVGMSSQADRLRSLSMELRDVEAVIEKVGTYVPGNSGPAAVRFSRHCGNLESALYLLDIPTTQVAPGVWQRSLGTLPKDKPARKRAIREIVARRFPHLNVTLKTADALGILVWAQERRRL